MVVPKGTCASLLDTAAGGTLQEEEDVQRKRAAQAKENLNVAAEMKQSEDIAEKTDKEIVKEEAAAEALDEDASQEEVMTDVNPISQPTQEASEQPARIKTEVVGKYMSIRSADKIIEVQIKGLNKMNGTVIVEFPDNTRHMLGAQEVVRSLGTECLEVDCKVEKSRGSLRRSKRQKRKREVETARKENKRVIREMHDCYQPIFKFGVLEEGQIICNRCGCMVKIKESCR